MATRKCEPAPKSRVEKFAILACFDCGKSWSAPAGKFESCPACGSIDVQERELAEALR